MGAKRKKEFPDQCESRTNNQIQTTKFFKEFWSSSLCMWIKKLVYSAGNFSLN